MPSQPATLRFIRLSGLLLIIFAGLMVFSRLVQFLLLGDPPLVTLVQSGLFLPLQGIPSLVAAAALLLGMTGLYIHQVEQAGVFGLVTYILAFLAVSVSAGVMWTYAFAAPPIARHAPELLTDVSAGLNVPILASLLLGQVGWLLMGVSALKARVIPAWAAWVLIGSVLLMAGLAPVANTQLARLVYNLLLGIGPLVVGIALWQAKPPRPQ